MFYEEKVTTFADLAKRLRALDEDAGVRLIGGAGRKKFLVFVTRFGPRYTTMTYTMGRDGAPEKKIETLEVEGFKALVVQLRKFAAEGKVQAWVY